MLSVMLTSAIADDLPEGAIQEGSLANQNLIQDTMVGVAAYVATKGCKQPKQLLPYVVAMPSGTEGFRVWKELWVVEGYDKEYPVKIKFNEEGMGAANWEIED